MKFFWAFLFLSLTAMAQGPNYPYNVNLSFNASTGTVTGYNMYRASYTTVCVSPFAKLNATPFTGTTYMDSNPPQGHYCYAATALDGADESGMSNVDSNVVIPPPPPTGLGATVASGKTTSNVTFAWTQSPGANIHYNELFCKSSTGIFKARWRSAIPVTGATLTMIKGHHYCEVTAASSEGISGPSNQVDAFVQ